MERYRTTVILVVVLAILGVTAYFLNNKGGASSSATATPTPDTSKNVWTETADVDSLDVVSGTEVVSLRKNLTTTVWTIISPIKADADPFSVGSEADALKSLQATLVITSPGDLKQYGLDK